MTELIYDNHQQYPIVMQHTNAPQNQSELLSSLQCIKKHEIQSKNQFMRALASISPTANSLTSQPQQLGSYRDCLYSNTLFTNAQGEAKLHQIMKNVHGGLKFEIKVGKVVKDFAKIVLQQIVEQSAQLISKGNQLDQWTIVKADWEVSEKLWNCGPL